MKLIGLGLVLALALRRVAILMEGPRPRGSYLRGALVPIQSVSRAISSAG